jgi:hypothetical protein
MSLLNDNIVITISTFTDKAQRAFSSAGKTKPNIALRFVLFESRD